MDRHLLLALRGEVVRNVEIVSTLGATPEERLYSLVSFLPVRDETNEVVGVSVAVVEMSRPERGRRTPRALNEEPRHLPQCHRQAP